MQAGCIPIMYNVRSGVRELVTHGKSGFLVPKGGVDDVVDYVRQLHKNAAVRKRMGKQAMKAVRELNLTDVSMGAHCRRNRMRVAAAHISGALAGCQMAHRSAPHPRGHL
jgi:glycosyltransferase involved in cell wall biosynthesis